MAAGVLVMGPTMDVIGARWSFRIMSLVAIVTFVLYAVIQQFIPPVNLVKHAQEEKSGVERNEALKKLPIESITEVKEPLPS